MPIEIYRGQATGRVSCADPTVRLSPHGSLHLDRMATDHLCGDRDSVPVEIGCDVDAGVLMIRVSIGDGSLFSCRKSARTRCARFCCKRAMEGWGLIPAESRTYRAKLHDAGAAIRSITVDLTARPVRIGRVAT